MRKRTVRRFAVSGQAIRLGKLRVKPSILLATTALFAGVMSGGMVMNVQSAYADQVPGSQACYFNTNAPNDYYCNGTENNAVVINPTGQFIVEIQDNPNPYYQNIDTGGAAFTVNAGQHDTYNNGIHMQGNTTIINGEDVGMAINVSNNSDLDGEGVYLNLDNNGYDNESILHEAWIEGATDGLDVNYSDTESGFAYVHVNNQGHIAGDEDNGINVNGGGGRAGLVFDLDNHSYGSTIGGTDGLDIYNNVVSAQVNNGGGLIAGLDGDGIYATSLDNTVSNRAAFQLNNGGVGIVIGSENGVEIEGPVIGGTQDEASININNDASYSYNSDPNNLQGVHLDQGGVIAGLDGDGIDIHGGDIGSEIGGHIQINNSGTRDVLVDANSLGLDPLVYDGTTTGPLLVGQALDAVGFGSLFPLGIYGGGAGVDIFDTESGVDINNGARDITQAFDNSSPGSEDIGDNWISGGTILGVEGPGVAVGEIAGDLNIHNGIEDQPDGVPYNTAALGGLIISLDDDGILSEDIGGYVHIDNTNGTIWGAADGIDVNGVGFNLAADGSDGPNVDIHNAGGQIVGFGYGGEAPFALDAIHVDTGFTTEDDGVYVGNGDFGNESETWGARGGVILGRDHAIQIITDHADIQNGVGGAILGSGESEDFDYFYGYRAVIDLHTPTFNDTISEDSANNSNIDNLGVIGSWHDLPHFDGWDVYGLNLSEDGKSVAESSGYSIDVDEINSDVAQFANFAWSGGQASDTYNPETGTSLFDYGYGASRMAISSLGAGPDPESVFADAGGALHVNNDGSGVIIGRVFANGGDGNDSNSITNLGTWYVQDTFFASENADFAYDHTDGLAAVLVGDSNFNGVDNAGLVQTAFGSEDFEAATFALGEFDNGGYWDPNLNEGEGGWVNHSGLVSAIDGGTRDAIVFRDNAYDPEGLVSTDEEGFGGDAQFHGSEPDGPHTSFIGLDVNLGPGDGELYTDNWTDQSTWRADRFLVFGNIDGTTGLILNNIADTETTMIGDSVIVGYAVNDGGPGCGEDGVCKEGDTVYIDSASKGYINVGGYGAIQTGLYAWYLHETPDEPEINLSDVSNDSPTTQILPTGSEDVDFVLVSDWAPTAFLLPSLITGAQNIWYDTAGVVEDHIYGNHFPAAGEGGSGADLDVGQAPAPAAAGSGAAIWGKISGSQFTRDTTVTETIAGVPVDIDTGLVQNTFSMLAGADFQPNGPAGGLRLGVYGSYDTSNLNFDNYDASATYQGGGIGAYASYTAANGFYADVEGKIDWLKLDYTSGLLDGAATATSFGILANAGDRMQMGSSFIEPIVSAAAVNTSISGFDMGGASVDFATGQSMRLGAGVRVGTSVAMGNDMNAEFSVLGKLWNEFEPANTVSLTGTGGGASTTFSDGISGAFAEVSASATVYNADKSFSGFVSVGDKFNSDFSNLSGKAGLRKSF